MAQRPPGTTTTRDIRMEVAGYRIVDVLGDGGSGVVFAATDASGRPVALKVLKPDLVSPRERQRFLEEAERLRRVRHPALVELYDAGGLPDGGAYIAMAREPGQNLADRLLSGPLRFDVALTLFEQLAGALQALHRVGLVHRDIKPENIFVVEGDRRALLLDLGIAREVSADPSTTTRAGLIRGTPAYMAPERFFGKSATPQTDIYELGVVLYFTLVGALPWSSFDNPTERLRPLAPSERGVVLPPRLTTTLMRALSAQAEQRPQSADEFAVAVLDALSPESIQWISGQRTARGLPPSSSPVTARTATVPLSAVAPSAASQSALPVQSPAAPGSWRGEAPPPAWRGPAPLAPTPAPHPATWTHGPATATRAPRKTGNLTAVLIIAALAVLAVPLGLGMLVLFALGSEPSDRRASRQPGAKVGEEPAAPAATCGHPGAVTVAAATAAGVRIGAPNVVGFADTAWADEVAKKSAATLGPCRPSCGEELVRVSLYVVGVGVPRAQAADDNAGDGTVAQCVANRMRAAAPAHPPGGPKNAAGETRAVVTFPVQLQPKRNR